MESESTRDTFARVIGPGSIIATAIHAGHAARPEVDELFALSDSERLREEDPFTDRLAGVVATRFVAHRTRFEVDLNRPRERAVYRTPDDAWGLDVWRRPPSKDLVARSLEVYDSFYRTLERDLAELAARKRRFVVLDIHSYNHRRAGPGEEPAPPEENPEVNLGTGSLDRAQWGRLAERFARELSSNPSGTSPIDVRENVRFRGGNLSQWIHERFAGVGCCLAIEFKKTYMDEWTGELDPERLAELASALESTLPGLVEELQRA
jgi:N-formylglutamate amidohydrolase